MKRSTNHAPEWLSDSGHEAMAVVLSLPQLAAACAGGVIVLLVRLVVRPSLRVRKIDLGPAAPA
jgi:hypothetical protein